MGGYAVQPRELVSVGGAVAELSADVDGVGKQLAGLARLPVPAAGTGIGAALASVQAAWATVLPVVSRELGLLGHAVSDTAQMYQVVEDHHRDWFEELAR